MDFYEIKERSLKRGYSEIYPEFKVVRSKDLMVRGGDFYAIWDEEKGMWSTDKYDAPRMIDEDLYSYRNKMTVDGVVNVKILRNFSSKTWIEFVSYMKHLADNNHPLDTKLTFSNTKVTREDYVSKRLPYPLVEGDISAYDELIGTLYDEDERAKLEWAIGSIVYGDSVDIQKFVVLYGEAGAGKSTILNIIQMLFDGYYTTFEAKALASANNAFSTEAFRSNPLVAIQHDGDLSRIEDNTKLNSIVSHELMTMNEKFKPSYTAKTNCFLFMATNKPVKITDAKSGIIRRLIDVKPSGKKIEPSRYHILMEQIKFELGAIAYHCMEVYKEMGKNYYSSYKPIDMIFQTDVFFNFVESYYDEFSKDDGITLSRAYDLYKTYCDEALVEYKLARHKFREELKSYFRKFDDVARVDGKQIRSYYSGFIFEKFVSTSNEKKPEADISYLSLNSSSSLFDSQYAECLAQYAKDDGSPCKKWVDVTTKLKDIDTTKVHYVLVPENHIVVDFDIKENGEKSLEKNLEAASKWPSTYAELSKSGNGVHLHYIYTGDVMELSRLYADSIEIKVFTGNSSLRRRVTKCNDISIASISSGLPKKEAKVVNSTAIKDEKHLRNCIKKALRKEIHPNTRCNVDFIFKVLQDAYDSGLVYDVTDMKQKVLIFASNSSNQAEYCIKAFSKMKFCSEKDMSHEEYDQEEFIFFDVEVFKNLFLINWKYAGKDKKCVRMINPEVEDVLPLLKKKLIGFNCRRYDNHILYAWIQGYTNIELYNLSQSIISGDRDAMFKSAYDISYVDVYDMSSKKQSLKKFEIELGIHHKELGMPWDEPVPEDRWMEVAEYCDNDVIATEAVFENRKADFMARKILAAIADLPVNSTTNTLTTKIIFGDERNPQTCFNYRDMGDTSFIASGEGYSVFDVDGKPIFPGYRHDSGVSTYRGEVVGEGGYVYAEQGIHYNVALLDIASMHPHSTIAENSFGKYTQRFKDIVDVRIAIKHKEYDKARTMLDGKLAPFLEDESSAADLASALKIAINSVYGLTSAKFMNPFRDIRNKDNIVAKRGALFMINLKHEVQRRGFTVAHIKTDSIKIPDATPEIIEFVMEYGKKYGYSFEHEATYEKMCLVNDAVYIAKYKDGKHAGEWTATGAQFQHPYVFKYLFSKEPITFSDMCETKSVSTALYLDHNEDLPEGKHAYEFVGRVGLFCPMKKGAGGAELLRKNGDKFDSATGAKGYRWLESEYVEAFNKQDDIDISYFRKLVDDAVENISNYGNFDDFVA